MKLRVLFVALPLLLSGPTLAAPQSLSADVDRLVAAVEPELIQWRRHLHENPELSNRETETAKYVVERLKSFGLAPKSGIAKTGVVAVLTGGRPGPVVALRADMDGLPVREETGLPFASKASGEYEGNKVGVMHACGHDTHVAMLLAVAKVLTQMKDRLPGTVKFVFQPAEEGAPPAEGTAGAELMVNEGVMQNPKVDAIFGLHVFANVPTGTISYRSGPFMAAADRVDITSLPAVVTVGQFQSGIRNNIIPDTARLVGTIRTFDPLVQEDIHVRVKRIAEGIASGAGAKVDVIIRKGPPVTANDPALTAKMLPTLERIAPGKVKVSEFITGAEDFTFFQKQAPGLFFFLGITPPDQVGKAPANHSPLFIVDEKALPTGVRAFANLAVDYLSGAGK